MSRFKLFGIMQAMIASIMANPNLSSKEKSKQTSKMSIDIGRTTGNSFVGRILNQRQKRKRWAQTNQYSKH